MSGLKLVLVGKQQRVAGALAPQASPLFLFETRASAPQDSTS